jgi:predicted metal-dependent phosphotriesterase family hydrolase
MARSHRCRLPDPQPQTIMTVTGPIDGADLGVVLPHEHLYINLMAEYRGDGLINDATLLRDELVKFTQAGGRTIIDCTNEGLVRNPIGLRLLSEQTSVNIVMGCGYYRDPYLDKSWFDEHDVDAITDCIVADIETGAHGTDVRAGIIGEIGCDKSYVSATEERSFRAAARAHLRTGLTVTTHAARWPVGHQQLDILEREGVPPGRVIIGHCDTVPDMGYHLDIARRGAFVEFDTIRGLSDYETGERIRYIQALSHAGYLERILLSHDVCLMSLTAARGGCGFVHILQDFVPRLRATGFDENEISMMLIDNPRRALTGDA